MGTRIRLGDLTADVILKDIKNVHLSVHPPGGRVTISAPARTDLDTLRVFAASKLGWIRRQQRKFREQERETPRECLDRESHYVWGRRYLLTVECADRPPAVTLRHRQMTLTVRPGSDEPARLAALERWYRDQIRAAVPALIAEWEPRLGVSIATVEVRRMKTRWGSCTPSARSIRLNTDLAKKPKECLEYIVVHEMLHLLEPTHNARFVALMDRFMPDWPRRREVLNRLPVRHEAWDY